LQHVFGHSSGSAARVLPMPEEEMVLGLEHGVAYQTHNAVVTDLGVSSLEL
jgi:hypothetical protein